MTKMALEEETQKCSNSNDGGGGVIGVGNIGIIRSSKKQKQKKVPQRGLGVAQLEKIRLEEQQKKDGCAILKSPPPISSPSSPPKPSNPSVPIPNYHSSIPYTSDISSPNSILRPQNIDNFSSNTVPLGWESVSVQGHGHGPKIWNSCEFNLEKENCGVDPGLAFRSSLNLPYESNSIWPDLHSLMQRSQYHLSPPPSMMHVSSTSSSSSLLNLHMELPSNQNFYGNYAPVWPEEEKMVGMKRPYPFALDNPPGASLQHCKFPAIIHPIGGSDESTSFGNGGKINFTSSNLNFREGPSCSDSLSEPKHNSKKNNKENGDLNGDFLTLAPPATTLTCANSKLKRPSAYLAFHNCETFDFSSLPYQGIIEDPILQPGSSVPNQLQPYYSFIPQAIMQIGQATKTINNCNGGEVEENVDLSLKL